MLDHISETFFSIAGIILEILSLCFVFFLTYTLAKTKVFWENLTLKNNTSDTASNLNPNPSKNDHMLPKPKYDHTHSIPLAIRHLVDISTMPRVYTLTTGEPKNTIFQLNISKITTQIC